MFRELLDCAPDAMIAIDRQGRIVHANAQAMVLFGYAEGELTGAAVETLVPSHARAAHVHHRDGFAASPRQRPMGVGQELSALRRDGKEFPVEIALSSIDTPDGQVIVASIRDVSKTHRARQALARSRYDGFIAQIGRHVQTAPNLDAAMGPVPELIAGALHVSTAAILCRHAKNKTLQARAAFGLPQHLLDALPLVLSPDGLAAEHPTVIAKNSTTLIDAAELAGTGFSSAAWVPLIDGHERAGILVVFSREHRQFDCDAVNFLELIANQLDAASQRIHMEEQLAHAQRLEAVGQLTGGIAHDFNNLLTVISGNLEILESGRVDGNQMKELIGNAMRAVVRGAELTRKLLAFARRQRLSPAAIDPRRLLRELDAMLKRTLGEAVRLEISCPDDIPAVYADPGQLEGALVNLAINSRDAMPRGGHLSITASKRQHSDMSADSELMPGDYVVFAVQDTGLGMTPEVLKRAFEPFFTTKEMGKGSGLGLSMVYGFIKQSGGHIAVDSRLGYGTSIKLHLPMAKSTAKSPAQSKRIPNQRGQETILVVEDEPDVREIAMAFLRSAGYTIFSASSAEAALVRIAGEPSIALLFSDVVLSSGMTGVELAREVRRLRPDLPILLTSGYEGSLVNSGSDNSTEFGLIRKPYRRPELLAAVRTAFGRAIFDTEQMTASGLA